MELALVNSAARSTATWVGGRGNRQIGMGTWCSGHRTTSNAAACTDTGTGGERATSKFLEGDRRSSWTTSS